MKLTCETCGKEFERRDAEVRRNQRLGRRIFCSRKCTGKACLDNIPVEERFCHHDHLNKGSEPDQYSPYRWHYRNAKRRGRDFEITLDDLKEQWEKQRGVCPYTGWQLKNMPTIGTKLPKTPDRASLDRIDSSKGYVKGNIQFVCYMAQCAKNEFEESELAKFCEAVVANSCASAYISQTPFRRRYENENRNSDCLVSPRRNQV